MFRRTAIAILTILICPVSLTSQANEATGPTVIGLRMLDVAGKIHQLGDRDGSRGVALVFLSPECPVSNQYLPELNRIAKQFADQPVEFYGVVADPTISREKVKDYCRDFGIEFPVFFDAAGLLARVCQPSHVPQAFVVDSQGAIAYRGRIDDQYTAVGRRKEQASEHDFSDAIGAVIAGNAPKVASTEPVGCRLEPFKLPEQITYTRHIAPILFARCVGCHRQGEVAPFPLVSYEDAAKRAGFLAEVTGSRLMPPWHAHPDFGHFRGDRRLSDPEIELIAAWVKAEAPRGDDADQPPLPEFTTGWQLGEPDLVLAMNEDFQVKADGPDSFRFFVIPIDIPEDKVVAAVEFRPGNPRVVHHAILYLDASGMARKRDLADPEPGYEGFLTGGFQPSGTLGFWAPGYTPRFLPDGIGQHLKKGTDLAMQLHYHPSGRAESDRSQIGVHFADKPVERFVSGLALIDFKVNIPAGETGHKMHYSFTTPVELELMDVTPHMHMVGTQMKVVATQPDGQQIPLVWSDWNFNWQEQYLYREPVKIPAGTRFDLEAWYDNSAANPYNPNQPPARVRFGEMTTDEMCICAFRLIGDPDAENGDALKKALSASMKEQLNDPAVMLQVMQVIARGTPKGEKVNISAIIGAAGGDRGATEKSAEPEQPTSEK